MNFKNIIILPAIFTQEEDYIIIEFIDFPEYVSQASTLKEALFVAQEVASLCLYLEDIKNCNITSFYRDKLEENQFIVDIPVEYPIKSEDKYDQYIVELPISLSQKAFKMDISLSDILIKELSGIK